MSHWFERFGYAEVAYGLFLGAYPQDAQDVAALQAEGITRVLNMVQDSEYEEGARAACEAALVAAGIEELRLGVIDFGNLMPGLIEQAVQTVLAWLYEGQRVYLHCRAGWQRSAAVAGGVVALYEQISLLDALELVRTRKPTAAPLPHQREDLATWWIARQH